MNEKCNHIIEREFRQAPERFLKAGKNYTLEEVLNTPVSLSKSPFEYNSLSPTPLDPDGLRIHGLPYAPQALDHLHMRLSRATAGLEKTNPHQVRNAEAEITFQHDHRMQKNAKAMDMWRNEAAKDPTSKLLSHADAEGIVQVRAGIARPRALIELIARNPTMGGVEIAKATRPFCMQAHVLARNALMRELNESPYLTITGNDEKPYRAIIDEHNVTLITKTKIADVALRGVEIEVVSRESGVLYNPDSTPAIPESMTPSFNGLTVHVAPLDITSYARVKSS